MTKEEVVHWLTDHPKDADEVRELLCSDDHVYRRVAKLLSASPSNFYQILAFLSRDDHYLETALELKHKLEITIFRDIRHG